MLAAAITIHVRTTPHAPAVVTGERTVTYGELGGFADRFRRVLLGRSHRDGPVLIAVGDPATAIEAIVACVLTATPYVCLDLAYPGERLAHLVRDSAATGVVIAGAEDGQLDWLRDADRTSWTVDVREIRAAAPLPATGATPPDAPCYVVYTSGSTGRPKPIGMTAEAIGQFAGWLAELTGTAPGTSVAHLASRSYDAAYAEIFTALATGATVRVPGDETRADPAALARWLVAESVGLVVMIPSLFAEVLHYLPDELRRAGRNVLDSILLAGEALPVALARRWLGSGCGPTSLWNMYGPTECVLATYHLVDRVGPGDTSVPIGTPIPGRTVQVLDDAGDPVAPGTAGEIHIRSRYLTAGYVGRPEETAAAFRPDPSGDPAARWYRTGDLGRVLPTGALEFLGRRDDQVKVRGFRVELGEVDAALRACDGVEDAVTVPRRTGASGDELIGYVTGTGLSGGVIREKVAAALPGFMVPATVVVLDRLPRLANGKIDRRGLPAPAAAEVVGDDHVAPRNELEEAIARIWADVLHRETVGVHDNFFDLGGHSLSVMRVKSRLRDRLGIDVTTRTLFDTPTIAELTAGDALATGQPHAPHPLTPSKNAGPRHASPGQERLWLAGQWSDDAARSYAVYEAFRVRGELVADALSAAVADVVARHEVLRTGFELVDDTLVRRVADQVPTPFEFVDLSAMAPDERERRCRALVAERARHVFDMGTPPLLRVLLIRSAPAEHVVLLVQHHIVTDEWSLAVLYRELGECYAARLDGRPAELPALPVQYGDYAVWQRERLRAGLLDDDLAYWRDRLDGAAPLLELPLDSPRGRSTGSGGELEFVLDRALVTRLEQVARRQDATLFMTMLACLGVVLSRYARTADVVIGSLVAGRTMREVEDLLGFFVNTVPLRLEISEDVPFSELLRAVRDIAVEAYVHQEYPFERLVEAVNPQRDPSYSPVVQVVFALQRTAPARDRFLLPGTDITAIPTPPTPAKFDLAITADEDHGGGGGIRGVCEYNADIFRRTTVERLLANWRAVLTAVAGHDDIPVTDIPMVGRDELELVTAWGRARHRDTTGTGLVDLFDAQVLRHPNEVAVTDGTDSLTYHELDRVTDRLARRLRAHGVTTGTLVGISLPRSLRVVVAILGTLKAGAAYLPLDPAHPSQRLDLMVEDAGLRHVITTEEEAGRFPRLTTITPETTAPPEDHEPDGPPLDRPGPDDIAYVIYTSGSTGKPKGVVIDHRNVVRLVERGNTCFRFDERDTWLLLHSYAFDVSVWEMWGALAHGGRLVVPDTDTVRSAGRTLDLVAAEQVSVLNCTPALFAELSSEWVARGAPALPALRYVVFAGAALDRASVRAWWRAAGQRPTFVNMYGITETTVHVTFKELAETDLRDGTGTPIGRALDDLGIAVVDDRGRRVPIGVLGEICVAGPGLGRGYLGRDDLTGERFRTDFVEHGATRYYRSGDLARWLPTGELECFGRDDDQVKIRGFRVELGEVETILRTCAGVDNAVATVSGKHPEQALVAHVVPDRTTEPVLARLVQARDSRPDDLPMLDVSGLSFFCYSVPEAQFLVREVVDGNAYLRDGITVAHGDCVIDIGANIGLFSLHAACQVPDLTVVAVEPVPEVARVLRANLDCHLPGSVVIEAAVGAVAGHETLTFYPQLSILSGRFGDVRDERRRVAEYIRAGRAGSKDVEDIAAAALDAVPVDCQVLTLSQIIDEHALSRVDLLKVDAEKSELEVLRGVAERHWPLIRQVVVEVHDIDQRVRHITGMLGEQGFRVVARPGEQGLVMVHAVRETDGGTRPARAADTTPPARSVSQFRARLQQRLASLVPDYLVPTHWSVLPQLPRTPNGKVDRDRLPEPGPERSVMSRYVPPTSELERLLARIWSHVLGVDQVGVLDNFFELGGHSLLAIRVAARIDREIGVSLPMAALFRAPTITRLADVVTRELVAGLSEDQLREIAGSVDGVDGVGSTEANRSR